MTKKGATGMTRRGRCRHKGTSLDRERWDPVSLFMHIKGYYFVKSKSLLVLS
ncbi:MAG: hypothetical protein O7157_00365 [Wolbachia endosymbiont of Tetragnatha montana]|nr:hypothetical protein [Wolbachia endosymbiont of Tetragnatha montana]